MPEHQDAPNLGWVPAWADLQGRSADPSGTGFLLDGGPETPGGGQEFIAGWPGADTDALAGLAGRQVARVALQVSAEAEAPSLPGFVPAAGKVLLAAPTDQLNTGVDLPENCQVALAPMETYDAVEITVFDDPVAKGRIQVRDGFATVSITGLPDGPEQEVFSRALFAAMAEEAFLHGAEQLHMVVEPDAAPGFQESGWTFAGRLLGFARE